MSDDPLTFHIEFTLPDYNATKRHTVGGARGQIDITEASAEAWEALVTHAVRHKGAVFGAVIVVLVENENLTELDYATKEEPKRKAAGMDLRRAAKRRN